MASTDLESARDLLAALDRGGVPLDDAAIRAEELDPVLVYATIEFLRKTNPPGAPAGDSVLQRVAELLKKSRKLVALHEEGRRDPVARWFESEYEYRDFRGRGDDLLDLLVDKLES